MSRRVLFEPEASAELEDAALWYEAQRSGLGLAFLAAVDRAVEHLAVWPDSGVAVPGVPASFPVHQLPLSGFPYRIAYMATSQELRVLAVAHARRRPGYWHARPEP
ncbi:MAG: type II toxin-antitoxin system RelE/ParE family toxin [Nitriliruptor sp.]|nr:MAG: type II toxin-antitoxin system RelE/ParE family toxin [Nitriliruptor sp.]